MTRTVLLVPSTSDSPIETFSTTAVSYRALISPMPSQQLLMDDSSCEYLRQRHTVPAKDEGSHESTKEDADDDVPVVVHREQHDDVGDRELSHVQERSHELLEQIGCEGLRLEEWRGRLGRRGFAWVVRSILEARGS
jgi:hypothetical protein